MAGSIDTLPRSTLLGNGTIGGSVTGAGRVAPGNSPGVLTINGNYTQSPSSTLEIEVASFSGVGFPPTWDPGVDHDQLVVGGTAALGGRLEAPVIDPLKAAGGPTLGLPPIEFLTAGSVVGEFSEITSPGLEEINPDLTVEVDYLPGGATLSFVGKKLNLEFNDDTPPAAPTWQDLPAWKDTVNATGIATEYPTHLHDLEIVNDSASEQTVSVVTPQEQVARLFLGDGGDPATEDVNLVVGDGAGAAERLTSVTSVNVRENGVLCLHDGVLGGVAVNVTGGRFEGTGVVDLLGGEAVATAERTVTVSGGVFAPGTDAMGMEVGEIIIEGNYTQGAGGVLAVDLKSAPLGGNYDKLEVEGGTAQVGGTLRIDLSNLGSASPGEVYTLITADEGGGSFSDVEVVDPNNVASDLYATPFYGSASAPPGVALITDGYDVGFGWRLKGDVVGSSGDAEIDGEDAMVFAAVLASGDLLGAVFGDNPEDYATTPDNFLSAFNWVDVPGTLPTVDFFDVPYFAEALAASQSISLSESYARIEYAMAAVEALGRVPEPSTGLLVGAALVGRLAQRRNPGNS